MKRTLFLLFIAITSFTACKKDPQEKLEGRWDQIKLHAIHSYNGAKTEENKNMAIGESYYVFSDNTYKVYQDGELVGSGPFTATENSITLTQDQNTVVFNIRWSSKKQFVASYEINQSIGGNTISINAELTFKKH